MITESQQEQASLYALGLLDEDERTEFERALMTDAELRALVDELRESVASVALAAGPETIQPPAALKTRLLASVARENAGGPLPGTKIVRGPWAKWTRWTLAAACLLLGAYLAREDRDLQHRLEDARGLARQQGQTIRQLDDALTRRQASPLLQLTVCSLEPTPKASEQPRAVVAWDAELRTGKLSVTQLKPPGESHDYQLWVVEEGSKEPVSAGLVRVSAEGRTTVDFKPADPGNAKVNAFALSLERAGGSERNQGPILLLGKL